jgi:hypothetical protein
MMQKHITVLAWLYVVFNIIGVLVAILLFAIIFGGGLISGDSEAIAITAIVATVIGFMLCIFSVPGIIGGIGLLYMKSWARILVLILGFLELFNFPFGTALGIYTIWILMKDETIKMFEEARRA